MFVLPPPPRYPITAQTLPNGAPAPMVETNNTINHPSGPEYQLVVGEGTYILRDDVHLATPPPHPSDAPIVSANPLSTNPSPPTSGTKLSLVIINPRRPPPQLYRMTTPSSSQSGFGRTASLGQKLNGTQSVGDASSDGGWSNASNGARPTPAFGEGNPSLVMTNGTNVKDPLKRRKPKNNIVKSNSSFVSRVIPHEALSKRLQDRSQDGLFAFANVNRAFQWLDLSSSNKQEQLTKILFTKAHALCHDINVLTKTSNHIDVIMGFSTGDVIWYEPISQKYARINKNGVINSSPISDIRWVPGSENLFLAAHMDGSLVVYDKEKEDAGFIPEDSEMSPPAQNGGFSSKYSVRVMKSIHSRNQKFNPVACWKLSNQRINAFTFSPDCRHLAVVAEDGSLRVIDYLKEQLLDIYTSYYGGFLCVCWSPDGKYVLTGGQDDLVSIWSLTERCIVARCQGHNSWVNAVAFDPWRCDERNYRFGSVGEDCRLLLWDFNVGMLHRPKAVARPRGSIVSANVNSVNMQRTESQSIHRLRSNSTTYSVEDGDDQMINHPVEPRALTAMLPPVMAKSIDPDPLSWLGFEEDCIITACSDGHIRTWDRPREMVGNDNDDEGSDRGSPRTSS